MKVTAERFEDLSCTERLGVITSLTRKQRIVFEAGDNPPKNFNILKAALNVVPQPLTPPPTATIDSEIQLAAIMDQGEPFGQLVLVSRDARIAENEKWCVDVTLHYEHIMAGPNQSVQDPQSGIIFGKGKTSVVDKTTNFFWPNNDRSKPREVIQVSHTFPDWEQGIIGQPFDKQYPRTIFQGGEISIPFPQSNFGFSGWWDNLLNPVETSFKFVGKTNKNPWMGGKALTWLCSEMAWEAIEPSKHRYKVNFEFQYNIDTWHPTVVFLDSRTGRPPADVEPASVDINGVMRLRVHPFVPVTVPAGMWQVPAVEPVDFKTLFGAFFNGNIPADFA